jgi:transcriptional regulator with PAS, ATPase and Fis domain
MRHPESAKLDLRLVSAESADWLAPAAFVCTSVAARRVLGLIPRLGATDATVLLLGESGTGKSLVARLVHEASPRAREPFQVVNCAAIPEQLIESHLFGHTRGAFTGAVAPMQGAFEAAGHGTIFLDEIAEIPLTSQAKLLRVLEERRFEKLGSSRTIDMPARVIAATNRDVSRPDGALRADLYYRLSAVCFEIPALRDREGDVITIAERMLRETAARHRKSFLGFTAEAVQALRRYRWPGNVRELRNVVETAVVLGSGPLVAVDDLPPALRGLSRLPVEACDWDVVRLPVDLAALEARAIEAAIRVAKGNRTHAAALLGINRVTLYKKLRRRAPKPDAGT